MRGGLLSGLVFVTLSGAVEGFFTLGHLSSGAVAARRCRAMRGGAEARPDRAITGRGRFSREPAAALTMAGDFDLSSDPFAASKKRAQTINYAFIAACVPGIMPYQDSVQSFVETTIECLDAGVSLGALDLTMSQTQSTGDEDIDRQMGFSQGRQFAAEEVALRRQWIVFVYAAALAVGSHAPEFSSMSDLASLSYVRNIYNNFWKKAHSHLTQSIDQEGGKAGHLHRKTIFCRALGKLAALL